MSNLRQIVLDVNRDAPRTRDNADHLQAHLRRQRGHAAVDHHSYRLGNEMLGVDLQPRLIARDLRDVADRLIAPHLAKGA